MTAQQRKFERKVKSLIKQANKLDDKAVRQVFALLRDARKRIADSIVSAEAFDLPHLKQIKDGVDEVILDFAKQYAVFSDLTLKQGWDFGAKLVDEPLKSANADFVLSVMPTIDTSQLSLVRENMLDLIRGISEEARTQIQGEIQRGIIGERTPNQVMRAIGRNITTKGTRFKRIADRAEFITRTETNRVLNMATEVRHQQIAKVVPGVKKYWLHQDDDRVRATHRAVGMATNPTFGGIPIPVNQNFNVGGESASGPHAPGLSAGNVVNCRCRVVLVVPENIDAAAMAA